MSKGVIYEVTLVDFIVRQDMEANGKFYKQVWTKPKRNEYEFPNTDLDEIVFSLKCFQGTLVSKPLTLLDDASVDDEEVKAPIYLTQYTQRQTFAEIKSFTLKKLIGSLKRKEVA